ncbi:hypothetical protein [Streptomyces sp. NPDC003730]
MSYPTLFTTPGVRAFAEEIDAERQRQLARWGEQRHPDGTGTIAHIDQADRVRAKVDQAAAEGTQTWGNILAEEVAEAFAESGPDRLRAELVQVAAVCAAWIVDLDSRTTEGARPAADETAATETQARRGDQVETWLKQQRDNYASDRANDPATYDALDDLLDLYRLHADTGTPLGGHVCEARVVGDCECLEQPAAGARQDGEA